MNQAKHTPGPWKWKDVSGAGLGIYGPVPFAANCGEFILKASDQPLFTLVAYEKWLQFPPMEWDEMQKANAALIAAAPDLLAALESLRAVINEHCGHGMPTVKDRGECYLAMTAANAAIDKAKGG